MKIYALLALRNLRRNLRRTLLTISGMAVGFAVLLWLTCILKGTNQQIVESVTSTQVGHLQLWRSQYLEDPMLTYTFNPKMTAIQDKLPPGSLTAERVFLPSLISSGEQSLPISLVGIDPEKEALVTQVKRTKVEGDYLSSTPDENCQDREIYISRGLADLLKVGLGDKVVLLAQAADGTLGNELLRVRGLFDSGSRTYDRSVAFASLACVRKIGAISGDHEVVVKLPSSDAVSRVRSALGSGLAAVAPDLKLTTWREAVPPLAGMVTFNEATLLLISLVLFGVTAFGVINTLLMSVFERTREFGVMLALGVTPTGVCAVILIEAALIGLIAAVIGTILGSALVTYHHYAGFNLRPFLGADFSVSQFTLDTLVHPVFSFERYFLLVGATMFFATLAGLIPALHASKMDVVEAIRHR
jgi:ABC-type lipoprotein release transport system permease subunit